MPDSTAQSFQHLQSGVSKYTTDLFNPLFWGSEVQKQIEDVKWRQESWSAKREALASQTRTVTPVYVPSKEKR